MSNLRADELSRALVGMKLVPLHQVDECLDQLGRRSARADELLRCLENRGLLTSYQVGRISKGEIDGLVLGHYKILYRNASGSFARVYRACDIHTGEMVGLKVLRQRWCEDQRAVTEFRREAELGKTLKHPNIVPIYEVGESRGQHYFSMEFVEGGNLRDFINIRRKLSPEEATRCVIDMTEGLAYAASMGATHRDLKMTNVLMSSHAVAKLVDFGLAGIAADERSDGESSQRALEYATLEKSTGAPRDDPRSDLYFLGTIYYELLTGVPPLARTRDRLERSQFSRYLQVPPVRSREPNLPRCVASIVDKLMQLTPERRYQNPLEVLRDLKSASAELSNGCASPPRVNGSSAGSSHPSASASGLKTIMCIEDRQKQQDVLRDYFSRHGFRVLVLSDLERGMSRLQSNPPDCMVIMGESLGDSALRAYNQVRDIQRSNGVGLVLVLGENQSASREALNESGRSRVVMQPITLRDLRKVVAETCTASQHAGTQPAPAG